MKSFIVLALCFAAALAAPPSYNSDPKLAEIIKQESNNIGVDGYSAFYETSNGIQQNEEAQLKNVGTENEALSVRGQYSYTGPDGVVYTVTYVADENGFQPQGAHIPQ